MYLSPIKLTNTETKYYLYEQMNLNNHQTFSLYNLDGSLYKTIQMPPKPDTSAFSFNVQYISRTLFDNDPSNIEYEIEYQWDSLPGYTKHEVKVIREDGTVLLDEINGRNYGVYSSEEGTKFLISEYYYANGTPCQYLTKVFNLPGEIPTNIEDKGTTSTSPLLLYPNPNNGSFFIRFHSNDENNHQIELYSATGKLIDIYKSFSNPTQIINSNLSEGVYLINTQSKGINSTTRMIIKK
jgi:hypothetical protein